MNIPLFFQRIFALTLLLFFAAASTFAAGDKADAGSANTSNTGGSAESEDASPVDVNYHKTKHKANLNEYGQFSKTDSVGGFAQKALQFSIGILGGIALLAIMIGGGMIMIGGTDETMLERGKDILKYTAIGVVIALMSVTITTLVQTLLYSVQ